MKPLSPGQRRILDLAIRYQHDTGDHCRISYLSRRLKISELGVRHHVDALFKKGWLEEPGSPVKPVCPNRSKDS